MAPTSFRILKTLAVGAASGLVLAACGGGNQSSSLASDQTLNFPILSDFGTLDPAVSDSETDQEIQQNMFDGLVKFDENLNIVPDLVTAVPQASADGLTYMFQLRQDVTFSNGDKFTSKDVLYSWNRAAAYQGSYATNLAAIAGYDKVSANKASGAALEALLEKNDPSVTLAGLTAPDPYTVQVKLSAPAGWFLTAIALSGSTGEVVDVKAVKQDPDNWWTKPATAIGTGPFKMVDYTPKQVVDFAAVDNWWGNPKPTLKKVHIDISVNNASTAIAKYEQGGYDIYGYGGYSNLPVADILRIKGTSNESGQLVLHPKVRTTWVTFNVVSDGSRVAKGPFTMDQGQSAHDLFLQSQWQDNLGVHVDLLPVSHSQFIKARLSGHYVISRDGWQADYNHPQDWYDNLWGKIVGCPDSGCSSGYDSPEYDQLLAKADAEPLDQAKADYAKLAQMLIDNVLYIPLYYSVGGFLIKPYVKGAGTNSFFDHYWNQIQILSH